MYCTPDGIRYLIIIIIIIEGLSLLQSIPPPPANGLKLAALVSIISTVPYQYTCFGMCCQVKVMLTSSIVFMCVLRRLPTPPATVIPVV